MAVAAAEVIQYISVDTIPGVAEERQRIHDEAWALVRQREEQLATGQETEIPPVIDALSTANYVLEARKQYGPQSSEYRDRLAGLDMDCLRLVAEWYRKKRPEYFPPVRHAFDDETEDFYSHGLSIRQMTENALRPISGDAEEEARRVNERVEHETPRIVRSLGSTALKGLGIRTISECTDKAIADYEHDQKTNSPHRGYGGYVPEIEKVMIRDMHIDPANDDRLQEQIALPGIYINHFVIQETLRRRGVKAAGMDKTELHGTQLLVNDDLLEFAALLDQVASEEWCTNVFMGEEVPKDFVKDYTNFRAEALRRQQELVDVARTVATFVLDLAEDGFDRQKAPAHVENFVKKLLLDMAKKDLGVAEQMFDEKTAQGLQAVYQLQLQGRHEEAFKLMQEVEKQAPGGGYCSGGSCGLEDVDQNSEYGKDVKEKLKAEDGDTIVKDKERKCKCGVKGVVYAYNAGKVNKYCTHCHAFESKQTRGKAA
jgi:hypothetical protein